PDSEWKNVRAENHRPRDENQQLRVEALRVGETEDENRRLRRLLALQERLPLTTLSAEIIGRDWGGWIRSLTVNRGRGDRVPRLTAVISPDGLIGRIVDVRPGASIVQVLIDPTSTVGAHVAYAGRGPAVDFAGVDDVLLVTGETRRDLAAYFTTGG